MPADRTGISRHPSHRPSRHAGFTLIEVLVALVVVALALGALVEAGSAHVRNVAWMGDRTLAHWVALNKAAELHAGRSWPRPGHSNGTAEMADRRWRWAMKVEETADETVRRVEITVRREEDDRDASPLERLTLFLGKP